MKTFPLTTVDGLPLVCVVDCGVDEDIAGSWYRCRNSIFNQRPSLIWPEHVDTEMDYDKAKFLLTKESFALVEAFFEERWCLMSRFKGETANIIGRQKGQICCLSFSQRKNKIRERVAQLGLIVGLIIFFSRDDIALVYGELNMGKDLRALWTKLEFLPGDEQDVFEDEEEHDDSGALELEDEQQALEAAPEVLAIEDDVEEVPRPSTMRGAPVPVTPPLPSTPPLPEREPETCHPVGREEKAFSLRAAWSVFESEGKKRPRSPQVPPTQLAAAAAKPPPPTVPLKIISPWKNSQRVLSSAQAPTGVAKPEGDGWRPKSKSSAKQRPMWSAPQERLAPTPPFAGESDGETGESDGETLRPWAGRMDASKAFRSSSKSKPSQQPKALARPVPSSSRSSQLRLAQL